MKEAPTKGIGPSEALNKEVIKRGSFSNNKKKKSIFQKKEK